MFWDFLKQFGFSVYEQRVLQALLQLGSGTASLISEAQNIPSSKIYAALSRLEKLGWVVKSTSSTADTVYSLAEREIIISYLEQQAISVHQQTQQDIHNLDKYIRHQSQHIRPGYTKLIDADQDITSELLLPAIQSEHSIYGYLNIVDDHSQVIWERLLTGMTARWSTHTDKLILYVAPDYRDRIQIKSAKPHRLRTVDHFQGNSYMIWGENISVLMGQANRTLATGLLIHDHQVKSTYTEMFDVMWFGAKPLN